MAASFDVLEILASGSVATLCVARRWPEGDVVALKVLQDGSDGDPTTRRRARDEARLLSMIRHPHIVRVDQLLQMNGSPLVVMEYVVGVEVEELLRDGVPAPMALEICRQVASALDAAWKAPSGLGGRPLRVIHRDIKPSNFMLSVEGVVKVIDFGTARAEFEGREADTTRLVYGSMGYMSPERVSGGVDTPAVDIYALGISLFRMLTARNIVLPRRPERHEAELRLQLENVVISGAPEATAAVRELIGRLVAHDPARRPHADQVVDEIGAIQERLGLSVDLKGWAAEVVVPRVAARKPTPPKEHPAWPRVAFVEVDDREFDDITDTRNLSELGDQLQTWISTPGWCTRLDAIAADLRVAGHWDPAPLLEILERKEKPWSRWFGSRQRRTEIIGALQLLAGHPAKPHAIVAERLSKSKDPEIALAARRSMGER